MLRTDAFYSSRLTGYIAAPIFPLLLRVYLIAALTYVIPAYFMAVSSIMSLVRRQNEERESVLGFGRGLQ